MNRSADIAVRLTRPRRQRLVARKIGVAAGGLYAAQSYVDRRGAPRCVDDLEAHDLIGPDRTRFDAALGGRRLDRADLTIRTDSDLAQLAAIRAGLGVGACQHWIARRSGGLLRVLPEIEVFSLDVWLAVHEDLKTDRVIRSVFDHLAVALYAKTDPQSPSER